MILIAQILRFILVTKISAYVCLLLSRTSVVNVVYTLSKSEY